MGSKAVGKPVSSGYLPCTWDKITERSQQITPSFIKEYPVERTGKIFSLSLQYCIMETMYIFPLA